MNVLLLFTFYSNHISIKNGLSLGSYKSFYLYVKHVTVLKYVTQNEHYFRFKSSWKSEISSWSITSISARDDFYRFN